MHINALHVPFWVIFFETEQKLKIVEKTVFIQRITIPAL